MIAGATSITTVVAAAVDDDVVAAAVNDDVVAVDDDDVAAAVGGDWEMNIGATSVATDVATAAVVIVAVGDGDWQMTVCTTDVVIAAAVRPSSQVVSHFYTSIAGFNYRSAWCTCLGLFWARL